MANSYKFFGKALATTAETTLITSAANETIIIKSIRVTNNTSNIMNKNEINKLFFEDLYKTQENQIHFSSVKNARKVILGLLSHVGNYDKYNTKKNG